MSKLNVLDGTGHTELVWDVTNETDAAVIAQAEQIVAEALAKKSAVWRVETDGETTTRLTGFDASAPEIVIVPQVVGG